MTWLFNSSLNFVHLWEKSHHTVWESAKPESNQLSMDLLITSKTLQNDSKMLYSDQCLQSIQQFVSKIQFEREIWSTFFELNSVFEDYLKEEHMLFI